MILHLVPATTWRQHRDQPTYAPEAYEAEGFVHCSPDDEVMLVVANRYYADTPGDVLVLSLDDGRLTREVRWEEPNPPSGAAEGARAGAAAGEPPDPEHHPLAGVRFPHVYGPLDVAAVVHVRRLTRAGGRFVGYEHWDG